MRYILNNEGYIYDISFGAEIECSLGTCTEYIGEIPKGYSSLVEWHDEEIERINAWKIVDDNLVFDDKKCNELQERCKREEIDNSCVTHKELYGLQKEIEDIQDISNSQYTEVNASGKVITIDNVKKVYPRIKLTNVDCYSYNKVDVMVTGKNILPNTALTQEISGITFTQNKDRSINIDGTATEEIEYNIGGTSSNTSPFLCLKKDINYYLNPIADGNGNNGIEWNGDTTGREVMVFEELGMTLYKVSDQILNREDLIGKTYTLTYSQEPSEEIEILETDYDNVTNGRQIIIYGGYIPTIVIVSETTEEVPYSTGTYFFKLDAGTDDYAYVSSLSSNTNTYQMKMYFNDGEEKTEIYSGTGGLINFTDSDKLVTQIVLSIPKGTKFDNVTIFPQLEVGSTATEYETYNSNMMTLNFEEVEGGLFPRNDLYPSDDLFPLGTTIEYILIENGKATFKVNGEITEKECDKIYLFDNFNTVYTLQDTYIEMTYCINNLKLEGVITKNNNFKVLADGSIEAHNGNFSGTINASEGVIGGFTLGTDKFSADISTTYNFTLDDANKVIAYVNGEEYLTDEELELYDVNGDGIVDRLDLLAITRMYYEYIPNVVNGTLEINSKETQRTIVLRDEEGKIQTSIGLNGITTPNLSVGGLSIENITSYSSREERIGTWFDKPLYRKTIRFDTDFNQQYEFEHGIENYEELWLDISNSFYSTSDGVVVPLISTSYYTDFAQKNNAMIYQNKVILYSTGGWGTAWKKTITINYTKTTDEGGE